mgnify:CR=1 FL=1
MGISTTKKVAKNTIIMYIRMLFLMFISFYSSRILLSTLGFEDFGIYSVVGSISTTFVALKSIFSESLQRFLNVAKGRESDSVDEQVSIFNIGVIVHIILAILFVVLVEVIGSWLLNNKLDIPEGRFDVAQLVFQMTILATAISILSIPFDALIISNEKMGAYAIISIVDGILKLLITLSLSLFAYDALMIYSILIVCIPVFTIIMQFCYCKRFPECKFNFKFNKSLFLRIMSLSGWNFFGNISFSLIHEGINMLLNMFGGVMMNAARSIAYQVKTVTSQISTNTMVAVRPMAMQQSVQKSQNEYFNTIILLSRVSLFAMTILAIPIFVYCPQLLGIWLKDVPDYAVMFTRIILISTLIRSLHEPLNLMNMALGSIKRMMLIESATMLSFLIGTYISLKVINVIWAPFVLLAIMELVIIILLVLNAKSECNFPVLLYCKKLLLPLFIILLIASVTCYICIKYMQPYNFISLVAYLLFLFLFVTFIIVILLDKREKAIVNKLLNVNIV